MEPLAEKAFLVLEERFMKAYYMPNDKLSENQLCKELQMSRTPIRQALSNFIESGYITSIDKKGIFVKPISIKNCLDSRDLLIVLEVAMANLLEKAKEELVIDIDSLRLCLQLQKQAQENGDYYGYLNKHFELRIQLFEYANNGVLLKVYKKLVKDIIRIVMIIWKKTKDNAHYSLISQNEQLLESIEQRKFEKIQLICSDSYTFELDDSKISMYKENIGPPDFIN